MSEPTINDAVAIAGNSPPQGNKIARVVHVKRVGGKARGGGKGKISWKTVILGLVALFSILGLVVVGVIGGVWWRNRTERAKAGERIKAEWEERERKGADAADNGHTKVQLWEGGPYWADTNIGAEKPWESGYDFWWGDTVGYKRQGDAWVASDGSKLDFPFRGKNTPTYKKSIEELLSEGWITSDKILTRKHDAAHMHWGGDWRMPTKQELHDLVRNCDWWWVTMNGVKGFVICGRGDYASSSIFLPAVGLDGNTAGLSGFYWSSVPNSDYNACAWTLYFYFHSSSHGTGSQGIRSTGRAVRPVQGFTKKRTKRAHPIL